jgi:hypothetical protein
MKIDLVLTAGNLSPHYTPLFPYIHKVWKHRFNLPCYMILISNHIPEYLNEYKDYIILWKPNTDMSDIYVAQVIRILYPALFDNKNVLITDLDIIPVSKDYFTKTIENYDENKFISYTDRYIDRNMLAVCYNVANSKIWKSLFNINNANDIEKLLLKWYNKQYTGRKNCPGWFTDQQKLYQITKNFKDLIIFKDKDINFKRSDNRQRNKIEILKNFNDYLNNIDKFTDIHVIRPFNKNENYIKKMVNKLI